MKYQTLTSTASRIVDRIDLVVEIVKDTAELLEANKESLPENELTKARMIIERLLELTDQTTQTTYKLLDIL